MTKAKLFTLLTVVSLVIPQITSARLRDPHPPKGCDLTVGPMAYDKSTEKKVATIDGKYDSTKHRNWLEVIYWGAPAVATAGAGTAIYNKMYPEDRAVVTGIGSALIGVALYFVSTIVYDQADLEAKFDNPPFTPVQKELAERKLRKACNKYLMHQFPDDVWATQGDLVLAHHYYCSEPYTIKNEGGEQYQIDILWAQPIYKYGNITTAKCERLQACLGMVNTLEEADWINEMKSTLGCDFSEKQHAEE